MHEPKTLSDNQRRFVCRIVFLVLCAIPTSVSVYSLFHRTGPEQWQNLVRAELGIPVQISSVETPVPFTTVLRDVRVPNSVIRTSTELETDLLIDEIRIEMGEQQNVVTIVQPLEIPARGLSQLISRCNDHLKQVAFGDKMWEFDLAKIVLTDYEQSGTDLSVPPVVLQPVVLRAWNENVEGVASLRCKLLAAVDPMSETISSKLDMELQKFPYGDYMMLQTLDGSIPARLLRFWQPESNWLGNGCRFNGSIEIAKTETVEARVIGQLQGVELDRLAEPYELAVRGTCDVSDIECKIEDDQISSARLRIHSAQQLSIGSSLLTACRQLGIQTRALTQHGFCPFPNIDLRVDIETGMLRFSGNGSSVISSDSNGNALATVHNATDVTIHNLASILIGDPLGNDWIGFLKRFRTPAPQRQAHLPENPNPHY